MQYQREQLPPSASYLVWPDHREGCCGARVVAATSNHSSLSLSSCLFSLTMSFQILPKRNFTVNLLLISMSACFCYLKKVAMKLNTDIKVKSLEKYNLLCQGAQPSSTSLWHQMLNCRTTGRTDVVIYCCLYEGCSIKVAREKQV